ncbi:hypothetical protein [Streptomyces sp. NPDC004284]|uniref:hypothetical protein n=1 Tax=Streptomyces sp. NPDC004284 TaxID=3364695 RepID=UPI0036B15B0E
MARTKRRWTGLGSCSGIAALSSVVLSLLFSILLLGLPDAGETALSWPDNLLRLSWIARILLPVALAVHVVIRLLRPGPSRPRDHRRSPLSERHGRRH